MLNQIQENPFVINAPISSAFNAGDVVIQSNVIGVAITAGVAGDTIGVLLAGIVELPADNTLTFVFGQNLYWNSTAGQLTHIALGNISFGTAALNKGTTSSVALVLLDGTLSP